jgi:hypothetical protein
VQLHSCTLNAAPAVVHGSEARGPSAGSVMMSRDMISRWLWVNGSAADCTVKVLVATSDRLTNPRAAMDAHEGAAGAGKAPATTSDDPASADGAAHSGHARQLTVQTGDAGASDSGGDVDSPVSLWISPSPTCGHSPLHLGAFSSSPDAQEPTLLAVRAIVGDMLDRVAEAAATRNTAPPHSQEEFQFDTLPHAAGPEQPTVWPIGAGAPPKCAAAFLARPACSPWCTSCVFAASAHTCFRPLCCAAPGPRSASLRAALPACSMPWLHVGCHSSKRHVTKHGVEAAARATQDDRCHGVLQAAARGVV